MSFREKNKDKVSDSVIMIEILMDDRPSDSDLPSEFIIRYYNADNLIFGQEEIDGGVYLATSNNNKLLGVKRNNFDSIHEWSLCGLKHSNQNGQTCAPNRDNYYTLNFHDS